MSAFLDTSVLVRYLTADIPELADQAERIIEHADELHVTPVVLAETAHVLRRLYHVPRGAIVDHLLALVQQDNIVVAGLDKGYVVAGLYQCRPSGRISIPDALVWAVFETFPALRQRSFLACHRPYAERRNEDTPAVTPLPEAFRNTTVRQLLHPTRPQLPSGMCLRRCSVHLMLRPARLLALLDWSDLEFPPAAEDVYTRACPRLVTQTSSRV